MYQHLLYIVAPFAGVDASEEVPSSLLLSEQMVRNERINFQYNFYYFGTSGFMLLALI